jgi:thymidylate synthase (FAD)
MMGVVLVSYTPNPELMIAQAASVSYGGRNRLTPEHAPNFLQNLVKMGHLSPFEHACFTFEVSGISRSCSHQLVRHRIASYTQQSQRYTKLTEPHFITPPKVKDTQGWGKRYTDLTLDCHRLYQEMVEMGIPMEDARYILPQSFETKIVMTMNARELINASELRLCLKAQWEIRELFKNIKSKVEEVAPTIGQMLKPKCYRLGFCNEKESCGIFPTRNKVETKDGSS